MNVADNSARPVFIVGCPRSGTTWLYHILLSAGRFAIYRSETQIYNIFAPCYGNFSSAGSRAKFLRRWTRSEYFLRSGLDADVFFAKAMQEGQSPGRMLRLFMDEICGYQQAARWAECTPDFSLHLDRITRDFPEALFVHIIRDGRDVALSLAKQGFVRSMPWDTSPEIAAAAYWHWVVDRMNRESSALGERLLALRYEDLVGDYSTSLERISAFIGQTIDPKRVTASSIGAVGKPNSSYSASAPSSNNSTVGRWRSEYSGATLAIVEGLIGRTLSDCGYPVTAPPAAASFKAALRRMIYSARFDIAWALKAHTFLGRFASDGAGKLTRQQDPAGDVTLRPGTHVGEIRRLVSGRS